MVASELLSIMIVDRPWISVRVETNPIGSSPKEHDDDEEDASCGGSFPGSVLESWHSPRVPREQNGEKSLDKYPPMVGSRRFKASMV